MTKLPKGLQGASQSLSCLPEDVSECFAHLTSYCIPSPGSFSRSGFKNTGPPLACSSLLKHLCLEQSLAPGLPPLPGSTASGHCYWRCLPWAGKGVSGFRRCLHSPVLEGARGLGEEHEGFKLPRSDLPLESTCPLGPLRNGLLMEPGVAATQAFWGRLCCIKQTSAHGKVTAPASQTPGLGLRSRLGLWLAGVLRGSLSFSLAVLWRRQEASWL